MAVPSRGEVWLADVGFAAKTRPVLVISIPFSTGDYALIEAIPHTTQSRGSRFEVELPVRFLHAGVFNVQGMLAVPAGKFLRRLGALSPEQMLTIERMVQRWLGLAE